MCDACNYTCCAMNCAEGCGCVDCDESKCRYFDDGFEEGEEDFLDEEEE
jgi:hypothetical protein